MNINYKKELELAAKNMIMVHEPDLLIKMIARTIVQKVGIKHAGILLHNEEEKSYILNVSHGAKGIKIPAGFARIDYDNALIRIFQENKKNPFLENGSFIYHNVKKVIANHSYPPEFKELLSQSLYQMEIFDSIACIPSYFRDDLLGVLLLGAKTDNQNFEQEELDFFTALASDVAMAIRNAQLFKELEGELQKKRRLFINTTVALAAAVDAKDHYTHGHINRVTAICLEIAKELNQKNKKTFDEKFMENLHIASLLHDIGKIGIPEYILNKEGPLNEEERQKINEHPMIGVTILQPISELDEAIMGVKHHHERYDGLGYPSGLKKEEIPMIAAIISVADTYDAMTSNRPYRKALDKDQALNEIKNQIGKQFHPSIAAVFVELFNEGKI
ncbi:MAG: HD-GYP domain-containing protein [Candidatus Omnitrophota bacterium]